MLTERRRIAPLEAEIAVRTTPFTLGGRNRGGQNGGWRSPNCGQSNLCVRRLQYGCGKRCERSIHWRR